MPTHRRPVTDQQDGLRLDLTDLLVHMVAVTRTAGRDRRQTPPDSLWIDAELGGDPLLRQACPRRPLGGVAALLSLATGATAQGATLIAAVLGVVTTAAGATGAYFHAGHFEAIALRYRETANALDLLKLDLSRALTPEGRGEVVSKAEAMMQAENSAWLGGDGADANAECLVLLCQFS